MHEFNTTVSRQSRRVLAAVSALSMFGAALTACGGRGDDHIATTIDTSALFDWGAIAEAVAAEHGAPGENEPRQIVLTGDKATDEAIKALGERGLLNVQLESR